MEETIKNLELVLSKMKSDFALERTISILSQKDPSASDILTIKTYFSNFDIEKQLFIIQKCWDLKKTLSYFNNYIHYYHCYLLKDSPKEMLNELKKHHRDNFLDNCYPTDTSLESLGTILMDRNKTKIFASILKGFDYFTRTEAIKLALERDYGLDSPALRYLEKKYAPHKHTLELIENYKNNKNVFDIENYDDIRSIIRYKFQRKDLLESLDSNNLIKIIPSLEEKDVFICLYIS